MRWFKKLAVENHSLCVRAFVVNINERSVTQYRGNILSTPWTTSARIVTGASELHQSLS
jgi:hypothetical protein